MSGLQQGSGYFFREFGLAREDCNLVMDQALSSGGDFGEIFFEHSESSYYQLQSGKVDAAKADCSLGAGVRVVSGDRVGYSHTQDLSRKSLLEAAKIASSIALGNKTQKPGTSQPVEITQNPPYSRDLVFSSFTQDARIKLLKAVDRQCHQGIDKIKRVDAGLSTVQRNIMIFTSEGLLVEDHQPLCGVYVHITRIKGKRAESTFEVLGGRYGPERLDREFVETLALRAKKSVLQSFESTPGPSGTMPVVLAGKECAILLHEAVGHGLEADFNRKGISTFSNRMGQQVAPKGVTIYDSALFPQASGSIWVDDEGTPGQRTVLIEDGILVNYLHDRISARHYGVGSTGSGRRDSYFSVVQPRMRSTCMENGNQSQAELIAGVKYGLFVERVSNGQVDIGGGDFSFFVTHAHMIRDGKLAEAVKDMNLTGNGPQLLQNIQGVGNDFGLSESGAFGGCGKNGQTVQTSFGQPSVLVSALNVGGSK